jgi:hypothetical protein
MSRVQKLAKPRLKKVTEVNNPPMGATPAWGLAGVAPPMPKIAPVDVLEMAKIRDERNGVYFMNRHLNSHPPAMPSPYPPVAINIIKPFIAEFMLLFERMVVAMEPKKRIVKKNWPKNGKKAVKGKLRGRK